jgi:selenide,water dikinase
VSCVSLATVYPCGETLAADEVVWVTQAGGAPGCARPVWHSTPPVSSGRATLQTVSDPLIFAAGDCAAMLGRPLEKAGVFAVRQGPVLAENLRRSLLERPLRVLASATALAGADQHRRPLRRRLACRMHAEGAWVWRWKDWLDRRFMRRFGNLLPMADQARSQRAPVPLDENEALQAIIGTRHALWWVRRQAWRHAAVAGARGASPDRARGRADRPAFSRRRGDAARATGKALVHTVDFFRAFIDDPWLFGRIAANHALGDIFAMGAEAQSATAIVTVPPGLERKVEDTVLQMMSGAISVLDDAGCALVGGHTGEGRDLALGFAINGLIDENLPACCARAACVRATC